MIVLDPEQILQTAKELSEAYFKVKSGKEEYELGEAYHRAKEMREEIRTHADYHYFPARLFAEKSPNQTPEEFEYQKSIYRPVTTSYWYKAVGQVNRIWNKQNYLIGFQDWDSEEVGPQDYFLFDFPRQNSIDDYFEKIVTPEDLKDPNAVLALMPDNWFPEETERPELLPDIYPCTSVLMFEEGFCFIKIGYTKLDKSVSSKGLKIAYMDEEKIAILVEKGKPGSTYFEVEEYDERPLVYYHDCGELPAKRLGGTPMKCEDGGVYFQSYFYPAVPDLDKATRDDSTLNVSKYTHAFPQRWQYVTECDNPSCEDGYVYDKDADGRITAKNICGTCHGQGRSASISPQSVMEVIAPNRMDDSTKDVKIPPAGYIEQNTDILDFLDRQTKKYIEQGFSILNLDVVNTHPQTDETAKGKMIDREELFSFLKTISTNLYGLMRWTVEMIGKERYSTEWEGFQLYPPQTFEIRSAADITEELASAPGAAKRLLMPEYARQRFGVKKNQQQVMDLAIQVDVLAAMTPDEVIKIVSSGQLPKYKAVLHYEAINLIEEAIDEDENFMNLGLREKTEILEQMAKDRESSYRPPNREIVDFV